MLHELQNIWKLFDKRDKPWHFFWFSSFTFLPLPAEVDIYRVIISVKYVWCWSSHIGMCLGHHLIFLHHVVGIGWYLSLHCMDSRNWSCLMKVGLWYMNIKHILFWIICTSRKDNWFLVSSSIGTESNVLLSSNGTVIFAHLPGDMRA